MDMVRPGIIVYGYYADEVSKEFLESKNIKIDLKPVMSVETAVCAIRPFTAGKSVGYGCTWIVDKDTDIAVLPVGYEDGWFRRFSVEGVSVSIKGNNYPVRGRICMDQCMIDLGKNPKVNRWDKVVFFGADNNSKDAEDLALTNPVQGVDGVGTKEVEEKKDAVLDAIENLEKKADYSDFDKALEEAEKYSNADNKYTNSSILE